MGLYLKPDLEEAQPLASNRGWSDVLDYVKKLPKGKFMELRHLAAYGWSQEVDQVSSDLEQALQDHAPTRDGVGDTLDNLTTLLEAARDAEVITVTNGVAA